MVIRHQRTSSLARYGLMTHARVPLDSPTSCCHAAVLQPKRPARRAVQIVNDIVKIVMLILEHPVLQDMSIVPMSPGINRPVLTDSGQSAQGVTTHLSQHPTLVLACLYCTDCSLRLPKQSQLLASAAFQLLLPTQLTSFAAGCWCLWGSFWGKPCLAVLTQESQESQLTARQGKQSWNVFTFLKPPQPFPVTFYLVVHRPATCGFMPQQMVYLNTCNLHRKVRCSDSVPTCGPLCWCVLCCRCGAQVHHLLLDPREPHIQCTFHGGGSQPGVHVGTYRHHDVHLSNGLWRQQVCSR